MASQRGIRIHEERKNRMDWLQENLFGVKTTHDRVLEEVLMVFFRYNPALEKKYQTFLKRKSQIQGEANADVKENE